MKVQRFLKIFLNLFILFPIINIAYSENYVLVSAAASLRDVFKKLKKDFEKVYKGCYIVINSGASGSLAIQIKNGAPADIFISASKRWADYVDHLGLSLQKKTFLSNSLALVTYKDSPYSSFSDIYKAKNIVVGNYKFAPFGEYTNEALKNLKILEKLKDKFVYANSVNQALFYLLSKEVDFGIIYYTDFLKYKDRLKLIYVFPNKLHRKINYYAILLKHAKGNTCAYKFYNYLFSPYAKYIFENYGFNVTFLK